MSSAGIEYNKLQGQIHELGRKNTVLKGHAEEVIHRSKVDLSDLKMEMLKEKGEVEKEKDRLSNEVDGKFFKIIWENKQFMIWYEFL